MAGFRALADRLGELAQVPSRAAKDAATRISSLVAREFETGTDPYGAAWKPLAASTIRRKGHDTILVDTGKLALGTGAKPSGGAGIELASVDYGQYHQSGTSRMPRRPIFPDRAELPKDWQEAIEAAVSATFRRALK